VLLKELEASVRLGVVFDVIFLYFYVKKKGYFDVNSQVYVKFSLFRPDLPLDLSSGVPLLFNVRH
jgi:hypothetical protein